MSADNNSNIKLPSIKSLLNSIRTEENSITLREPIPQSKSYSNTLLTKAGTDVNKTLMLPIWITNSNLTKHPNSNGIVKIFKNDKEDQDLDQDQDQNPKKNVDTRQSRSNLPKETIQILNSWLLNHLNNPYPTSQEKRELLIKTGLTKIQLSNWFINVRRRKIFSDYYNLAKQQNGVTNATSQSQSTFHNDCVNDGNEQNSTEVPFTRRKKLIDRLKELKKLSKENE